MHSYMYSYTGDKNTSVRLNLQRLYLIPIKLRASLRKAKRKHGALEFDLVLGVNLQR